LYVRSLDSKEVKLLIPNLVSNVIYAEPGYLVYFNEGNLMAQPFDPEKLKMTGEAFPLLQEKVNYSQIRALTAFTISQNGILAYEPEEPTQTRLVWLDASGKELESAAEETIDRGFAQTFFVLPRISPDGSKVSLLRWDRNSQKYDIWILQTLTKQLTRF